MKTVAVILQKGGSGKTTMAFNLAIAFAHAGKATVLLDLDPQSSACRIADGRAAENPVVQDCSPARLLPTMESVSAAGADICIIDTPPKAENASLAAAKAADLVVVPIQPARLDLDALAETAEILTLAKRPVLVVINRAPTSHLSGVIDQTKRFITEGYQLTVAETVLHNRMAYQHAMTAGLGLLEFEPKGAAAEEIRSLFREVIRYAGIEVSHQTVMLA
jgi:chromosome partitioning protein